MAETITEYRFAITVGESRIFITQEIECLNWKSKQISIFSAFDDDKLGIWAVTRCLVEMRADYSDINRGFERNLKTIVTAEDEITLDKMN